MLRAYLQQKTLEKHLKNQDFVNQIRNSITHVMHKEIAEAASENKARHMCAADCLAELSNRIKNINERLSFLESAISAAKPDAVVKTEPKANGGRRGKKQ